MIAILFYVNNNINIDTGCQKIYHYIMFKKWKRGVIVENIFKILYIINNNSDVNQRYLSLKSGLSIGNVNSIIKKLQEENYINIEKNNGKNIYVLIHFLF